MKAYFLAILTVEHDGMLTPTELCNGLGTALDDLDIEMNMTVDDVMGQVEITECLGVDELQPEQVEELIKRKLDYGT